MEETIEEEAKGSVNELVKVFEPRRSYWSWGRSSQRWGETCRPAILKGIGDLFFHPMEKTGRIRFCIIIFCKCNDMSFIFFRNYITHQDLFLLRRHNFEWAMAILSVPMWEKLSSNEAKSDMKSNMIMGFNQKYSSICSSTILAVAKHNPDIFWMFSSVAGVYISQNFWNYSVTGLENFKTIPNF